MDIHKNARSLPSSRALLVERVANQGWSLIAPASAAGLNVRRAREWCGRAIAGESLEDRVASLLGYARPIATRSPSRPQVQLPERVIHAALRGA